MLHPFDTLFLDSSRRTSIFSCELVRYGVVLGTLSVYIFDHLKDALNELSLPHIVVNLVQFDQAHSKVFPEDGYTQILLALHCIRDLLEHIIGNKLVQLSKLIENLAVVVNLFDAFESH